MTWELATRIGNLVEYTLTIGFLTVMVLHGWAVL